METTTKPVKYGRDYDKTPDFLFHTLEGDIMTLWARNGIQNGDMLIFSGHGKNVPHEVSATVIEIIENRDHSGFISVTDIVRTKNEKGESVTEYTFKTEQEKKEKSFYKVKLLLQ